MQIIIAKLINVKLLQLLTVAKSTIEIPPAKSNKEMVNSNQPTLLLSARQSEHMTQVPIWVVFQKVG